jgi:hypothetical protein
MRDNSTMNHAVHPSRHEVAEREALRRRVRKLYDWLNRGLWAKCFTLIDPKLTSASKVRLADYSDRMQTFKQVYGSVSPWHIRISLHLDGSSKKHDKRPFAYVYVVWQDAEHRFHMFRERWVMDAGQWFTRVVGLVPN